MSHAPRWFIQMLMEAAFFAAYYGITNLKRICMKNLYLAYGEQKSQEEYRETTKRCFKNISHAMLDLLYFVERPKELSKIVEFAKEEHLQQALQLNRGIIAVTAHLGNFPLMFISLVQRGYKVNVLIRPMRNKDFSKFMFDLCAKWKINMIQTSPQKTFLKESLGALKRNELLFFLLDEVVPQGTGVPVNFFNTQVTRATGPLLFEERMGSHIVPIFIAQDDQKHFKISIEEPLVVEKQFDVQENNRRNIASLTNTIERFVRKYPFQWGGWLNKRWAV